MNGLYVVYIERVVGRLAREVAPAAHQGKLDLEVFSKLLCWNACLWIFNVFANKSFILKIWLLVSPLPFAYHLRYVGFTLIFKKGWSILQWLIGNQGIVKTEKYVLLTPMCEWVVSANKCALFETMIQLIHLDCLMFKFWFIRETWNQIVDLSVWPDIVSCLLIVDYFLFADFTPYHVSFYRYALPYLQIILVHL